MGSANVPTFSAWGKAQYMDAIDVENRVAVEVDAPEPEVSFSLEEFDHYCELFEKLLITLENENRTAAEEILSEPAMGSASQHSNLEEYLDEFDHHEIKRLKVRFGFSDWPVARTAFSDQGVLKK